MTDQNDNTFTLGEEWQSQRRTLNDEELAGDTIFPNLLQPSTENLSRFLNNTDNRFERMFLAQDQPQNINSFPLPQQEWNQPFPQATQAMTDIFPVNSNNLAQFREYRNPAPALSERGTHTVDSGYGGDGSRRPPPSVGGYTVPTHAGDDAYGLPMHVFENVQGYTLNDNQSVQEPPSTVKSKNITKESLYCDVCKMNFLMTKSVFKKHQNRHERPFKCERCEKGFATNNDKIRHQVTAHQMYHLLENVYVCPECIKNKGSIKVWPRADNFKNHLFTVHSIPKTTKLGQYKRAPKTIPGNAEFSFGSVVGGSVMGGSEAQFEGTIFEEQEEDEAALEDAPFIAQPSFASRSLGMPIEVEQPFPEIPIPTATEFAQDADRTIDVPLLSNNNTVDLESSLGTDATATTATAVAATAAGTDWPGLPRTGLVAGDASRPEVLEFLRTFPKHVLRSAMEYEESDEVSEDRCSTPQAGAATHACDKCDKVFRQRCQLNKHRRRHDRLWGCTHHLCSKTFGSKNDLKRHEVGMHYAHEEWRCHVHGCDKVCLRRLRFEMHLTQQHNMVKESPEFSYTVDSCRIGRQWPDKFWCGFCDRHILPKKDVNAWDFKFDHIELHLFGRGGFPEKRMFDWIYLEEKPGKAAGEASDNENVGSGSMLDESASVTTDLSLNSQRKRKNEEAASSPRKRVSDTHDYTWSCCECGNFDMSWKLCAMCLECGHRRCTSSCKLEDRACVEPPLTTDE